MTAAESAAAENASVERAAVEIRNAHKSFGGKKVLEGIDLTIPHGSVTAILGPSGSGKSTLLRAINHLEKLDEGYVRISGELIGVRVVNGRLRELPEKMILRQRARIGFVFQNFNLFPHLTVTENIVEAPVSTGLATKAEARERAADLLRQVALTDKADAYPRQLSGGQQQRVAIARALALEPDIILFDEPTSALDPELVGEVLNTIRTLAGSGRTLIVVTHEIGFAREVADHVVFLSEGVLVEQGPPPQVLESPQHQRTRDFISKVL